jgi:DNA invertase Pin-like site-specific DNA recombinase
MDYVYTRVSTDSQTTDNQVLALKSLYPEAEIVTEASSGVKERPKLMNLKFRLKEGDRLIVYAIDRLGRSTVDLVNLFEELGTKGVIIVSSREGIIDRTTPMGAFLLNIMISVAQMERDMLRERVRAGLDRAKSEGTKLGRQYSHDDETLKEAIKLRKLGYSYREITDKTGVSSGSLRLYEKRVN